MEEEIKNNPEVATPAEPASIAPLAQAPQSNNQAPRGRRSFRGGPGRGRPNFDKKAEFDQKVLDIARVSRVTKGGKRFSFRATIVIGDGKSRVGVGIAKGRDVSQSIQKAYNQARKMMVNVPIVKGTIPYQVEAKYSSAVVILKPSKGGVKAGGPVRVVAKLAGITSLTGKLIERTNNKVNIAMATLKALQKLRAKNYATSSTTTENK